MKDTKERPIHVGKCYITCPENTKGQHFLDCVFHALDLTERDFSGSAFTDCVFEGVAADRGQWADTEFSYCKIRHSSFLSAILSRSTFTECIGIKNDYRYAAFRSTTRIGGREDEPSIEGMDITNSLFDQFVLFLAKGSAVGIEATVYTITDGKPGAVYLYQKGMPLLFAGYGWNNREGSRPERVEEMPETIQRFYRKFRHIQKKEATASVKTTAGKILEVPKPRQQFGVLWDYQPTPDPEDRYRAFVPVTLIYGDPSPDVPNLIQGWTTNLPKGDKAAWDDAVRRVTQRKGELTCKDCDGTGDTLEEALERAEKAWDEKKALLKLADQVVALVPDYRKRILPNASRRLQEAKKADTLTLFSKLQIEDAKEDLHQRETEFLKKLARRLRHTEPTSEAIQAVCQAMHEDNTPWNQKEALFDRFLQKADAFLYAPLRHRIEDLQKELLTKTETEGFEGALSVYQDAVKTYFRAKREFRLGLAPVPGDGEGNPYLFPCPRRQGTGLLRKGSPERSVQEAEPGKGPSPAGGHRRTRRYLYAPPLRPPSVEMADRKRHRRPKSPDPAPAYGEHLLRHRNRRSLRERRREDSSRDPFRTAHRVRRTPPCYGYPLPAQA